MIAILNPHSQPWPKSCDVLIVDDDVILGDTIARYLRRAGLVVRPAHSGSSALRVIGETEPRVALIDYELPDTTGVELASRLRERLPVVKMIMMSGSIPGIEREMLEAAGIMVFVNKPVPMAPLHKAIVKLLRS